MTRHSNRITPLVPSGSRGRGRGRSNRGTQHNPPKRLRTTNQEQLEMYNFDIGILGHPVCYRSLS